MKYFIKVLVFCLCATMGFSILSSIPKKAQATQEKTNVNTETEVTALKSNITNMNLKGYVGNSINNNITRWQIDAYRKNKNIIDQIVWANGDSYGIEGVFGTDYFGVSSYYDIDVVSYNGEKSLGWTLKSLPSSFGDRDLRYMNAPGSIIDWTGAKELWLKLDSSEIASGESVRIAFQDDASGSESYSLRKDATVYLVKDGAKQSVSVQEGGYVALPNRFVGYIALPLNTSTFERYWAGNGNGIFDISAVVQFQLAVKGDQNAVGKTLYMEEFAIVGDVDGEALPISDSSSDKYLKIWDFESLGAYSGAQISSLAWYGEFVGKLLTGMAYSYKISPSEELKGAIEEIIADLKTAQGDDGYLGVFVGGARYSISASNWDLWNQYHCITGLLEWYKQTESEDALLIAKKAIDCIYEIFKDRSYLVVGGFETNRAIAHGYAQMYEVTKDKKYLDEAERIIMQDCQDANGWYKTALKGGHFYQSSSNRWEVLHMIMTLGILYEYTGNQEYYQVMAKIWQDILEYDIHNGGGFTTNESALGDPYMEGVIETCCSIAWAAFSTEFYKYEKSVAVADELERTYYNAILGSLLDTDRVCTYNTPMDGVVGESGGYDGRKVSSQQDISFQYNAGSPDMNCCQANLARGLAQISEWACVTDGEALYLNYYGNSTINTRVGGFDVTLSQSTKYPVNGKVTITVSGLESEKRFALKLRIPSWAYGTTVAVNGERSIAKEGEYFVIDKTFKNGDRIELDIKESFTFWKGENAQQGYTSVYYGPVLLTLDQHFEPNENQKTAFAVKDFESAEISSATAEDCMLTVNVKSGDKTVKLVDFASAGKYRGKSQPSTYYSWLTVLGAPETSTDLSRKWMTSDRKKVQFDPSIESDRATYYVGERVNFKVNVPSGKEIKSVLINGSEIKGENGEYLFIMPIYDVKIEVVFSQKEQEEPTPKPDKPTDTGCKIF